jgi:cytoskeletal protein CcmA (bactofilin family)
MTHAPAPAPAPRRPDVRDVATIGRSIRIKGEVRGDEDLLIQGRIEGSVNLEQHSITVGADGEVKASIVGRIVTVEGSVEGNLTADEQVILRGSAFVRGDIVAPRVVLEDGARFRGSVDMGEEAAQRASVSASAAAPKKARPERASTELVEAGSGNGARAKEDAPAKAAV